MAVAHTNTRYLHEEVLRCAERLAATLPEPLSVCFLVNSGSEANDLALRLVRAATGAQDVICVEHGYHGHTQALIDMSPYKLDRPGGAGGRRASGCGECPIPTAGRYGVRGAAYADDVARCWRRDRTRGDHRGVDAGLRRPGRAAPTATSRGCLRARAGGGRVCIADEVQVGFGRVGPTCGASRPRGRAGRRDAGQAGR